MTLLVVTALLVLKTVLHSSTCHKPEVTAAAALVGHVDSGSDRRFDRRVITVSRKPLTEPPCFVSHFEGHSMLPLDLMSGSGSDISVCSCFEV